MAQSLCTVNAHLVRRRPEEYERSLQVGLQLLPFRPTITADSVQLATDSFQFHQPWELSHEIIAATYSNRVLRYNRVRVPTRSRSGSILVLRLHHVMRVSGSGMRDELWGRPSRELL